MKEKIKNEVARFKKFQQIAFGAKEQFTVGDIDVRNYAKYILREGADLEKRELLSCFKSKIQLNQKAISLKERTRLSV